MLEFKKQRNPIDINEVEPIEEILKRFEAEVYSVALSAEAHETLAVGMNKLRVHLVVEKAEKTQKDLKLYQTEIAQTQE